MKIIHIVCSTLRLQTRFKSDYHDVFTEVVNKIALSGDDDKRL